MSMADRSTIFSVLQELMSKAKSSLYDKDSVNAEDTRLLQLLIELMRQSIGRSVKPVILGGLETYEYIRVYITDRKTYNEAVQCCKYLWTIGFYTTIINPRIPVLESPSHITHSAVSVVVCWDGNVIEQRGDYPPCWDCAVVTSPSGYCKKCPQYNNWKYDTNSLWLTYEKNGLAAGIPYAGDLLKEGYCLKPWQYKFLIPLSGKLMDELGFCNAVWNEDISPSGSNYDEYEDYDAANEVGIQTVSYGEGPIAVMDLAHTPTIREESTAQNTSKEDVSCEAQSAEGSRVGVLELSATLAVASNDGVPDTISENSQDEELDTFGIEIPDVSELQQGGEV